MEYINCVFKKNSLNNYVDLIFPSILFIYIALMPGLRSIIVISLPFLSSLVANIKSLKSCDSVSRISKAKCTKSKQNIGNYLLFIE